MLNSLQSSILDAARKLINDFTTLQEPGRVRDGYDNRIPSPPDKDYAVVSILRSTQKSTPVSRTVKREDGAFDTLIYAPYECTVQLDFYGAEAMSRSHNICTVARTVEAVDTLKSLYGVTPIRCEDPINLTVVSAEGQYVPRWMTVFHFYFHDTVTLKGDVFHSAKLEGLNTVL